MAACTAGLIWYKTTMKIFKTINYQQRCAGLILSCVVFKCHCYHLSISAVYWWHKKFLELSVVVTKVICCVCCVSAGHMVTIMMSWHLSWCHTGNSVTSVLCSNLSILCGPCRDAEMSFIAASMGGDIYNKIGTVVKFHSELCCWSKLMLLSLLFVHINKGSWGN